MEGWVDAVIGFITAHAAWAGPVMFVVCFGESLAFLSLLFPGTSILIAAGTLVPSGTLSVWPLLFWSMAGAVLGDGVSYWIGKRFGWAIARVWPFRNRPELLQRGVDFFEKHGGKSVFIGRFFGPVRAIIPLAAGLMRMPTGRFWIANVTSAIVWAPAVLFPGALVGFAAGRVAGGESFLVLLVGAVVLFGFFGIWVAKRFLLRRE
jgi:undecaprenyl-diphosphatase